MNDPSQPPLQSALPVMVNLAKVDPKPVRWLWPDRIPLGKLSLLIGGSAAGKSLVALDIAARVSAGMAWPDSPHEANKPGSVLLFSIEDDLDDTVQPRLVAAGADLTRITAVTSLRRTSLDPLPIPLCRAALQPTLQHLETAIRRTPDCRLLIIDPLTRLFSRLHAPSETTMGRALMEPLADLAARCGIAVLAIQRAQRNTTGFAWHKTTAGISADAARTVWALVETPNSPAPATPEDPASPQTQDTPQHRLLVPIKSTIVGNTQPLACSIVRRPDQPAPSVAWQLDPLTVSSHEILDTRAAASDLTHAETWLREVLTESPTPANEVIKQGKDNALNERSIRRAFTSLGCKRIRKGTGPHSVWVWALPHDEQRLAQYRLDPLTEIYQENDEQLRRILAGHE